MNTEYKDLRIERKKDLQVIVDLLNKHVCPHNPMIVKHHYSGDSVDYSFMLSGTPKLYEFSYKGCTLLKFNNGISHEKIVKLSIEKYKKYLNNVIKNCHNAINDNTILLNQIKALEDIHE